MAIFCPSPDEAGITSWAQINAWRGETDIKEKIEQRLLHDLDYIDQWSLGYDLYILLKTPLALLKTQTPADFPGHAQADIRSLPGPEEV